MWGETKALHVQAERSGAIAQVLRGRVTLATYVMFLRSLVPAYRALEAGLERHRAAPGVRLVALPETYRSDALASDLDVIAGPGWEARMAPLPEAVGYGADVARAAEGNGARLIAHAYARTLGDLSGGQIMQTMLGRTLGLGPEALAFYRFPGIADIAAFKQAYRAGLDAAGREIDDADAVVREAAVAFRHNINISEAVASAVSGVN